MNILIALALLAQETPEESFRKVEAAITGAQAMRVTFKLAEERKVVGGGSLSVEGMARASIDMKFPSKGGQQIVTLRLAEDVLIIDDGVNQLEGKCDSKNQRSNFNAYLGRLGVALGLAMEFGFRSMSRKRGRWTDPDMLQLFQALDYKAEGEDRGVRVLSYRVKIPLGGDIPFPLGRIKIWYDPRTFALVRREAEVTLDAKSMTLVETYEKYELDAAAATPAAPAPPPPPPPRPLTDEEIDQKFIETKVRIANEHLKAGRKQKAIDALEGVLREFPKHPASAEARKLLEEAKK